jgi:hypothetical protein
VVKVLHLLNPLLTTKILATWEKRAQAAAAMMAVMVSQLPGMKKTLRRLILRTRRFSESFAPSRLLLYICTFT